MKTFSESNIKEQFTTLFPDVPFYVFVYGLSPKIPDDIQTPEKLIAFVKTNMEDILNNWTSIMFRYQRIWWKVESSEDPEVDEDYRRNVLISNLQKNIWILQDITNNDENSFEYQQKYPRG